MGGAIGETLPFAVGFAISPIPIIAIILMLITPRARSNGLAFLGGWVLGLVVVGGVALVIGNTAGLSSSGGGSTGAAWVRLALGLLLIAGAARRWRSRPAPGAEAQMPKWMGALDGFTPLRSLGVAAALSGVNPKNLLLNLGAMATVAQAGLSGAEQIAVLVVFVVIASATIIAPVVVYLAGGAWAAATLDGWKSWLGENNAAVMAVLFVVFGFVLIGQGITGLST
jgi:hypothetical protein